MANIFFPCDNEKMANIYIKENRNNGKVFIMLVGSG